MIPLKDNIAHKRFPYVNWALIFINVLVFIYELSLGSSLNQFINQFGIIPTHILADSGLTLSKITPLFSSMFMHTGLLHIGGNLLFLFIFGDNVEDSMGHFRYFIFFILVGVLSGLAHVYANPSSAIPSLGASGAVSGVLGAYFLLYPTARIATLIFLLFFFWVVEVPAWIFLGLWFFLQALSGANTINKSGGGVAFWAHIGGFVSGYLLILFFRRRSEEEFLKYF